MHALWVMPVPNISTHFVWLARFPISSLCLPHFAAGLPDSDWKQKQAFCSGSGAHVCPGGRWSDLHASGRSYAGRIGVWLHHEVRRYVCVCMFMGVCVCCPASSGDGKKPESHWCMQVEMLYLDLCTHTEWQICTWFCHSGHTHLSHQPQSTANGQNINGV